MNAATFTITVRITRNARGAHITMPGPSNGVEIHDVESFDCWCRPRYYLPCDECETSPSDGLGVMMVVPPHLGCWKCTSGLIELTREQADICEHSLVVVHRE